MRYHALLAASLLAAASVYGQAGLSGKWQTDNVAAALEAQKNAPPPAEGAPKGRGGRGGAQAVILDLTVTADGKISGMVNEIGNGDPLTIESGQVMDKTMTFVTQPRGVTWNVTITDDNTLTVNSRQIPGGKGKGGGGPGGPGGAGPGGPGGAGPGGGGPGGPGGGGPGGGGGFGGGGGGGGGGRGPQPLVLHRVK